MNNLGIPPLPLLMLGLFCIFMAAVVAGSICFGLLTAIAGIYRRVQPRQRAANDPSGQMILASLIRNGWPLLRWPAAQLLRVKAWQTLTNRFWQYLVPRYPQSHLPALSELLLAGNLLVSLLVGLLSHQFWLAGVALLLMPLLWSNLLAKHLAKRWVLMRDQIPDTLQCLGFCFLSGCSLQQAFQQTTAETPEPLRSELAKVSDDLQSGMGVWEALSALEQRNRIMELGYLAVALEIQHRTGGSFKDLLDAVAVSVRSAGELKRQLQVQTAQSRLSFKVVAGLPLALVAVMSIAVDGYLATFFTSVEGFGLLLIATLLEVTGILLIRRTLGVDLG
ncbi:MAG: type II secretion system F family protein [Actinomycetia bacterium]|nr:type II secretion system F family protein [Actinomycetes bacterium]